MKLPKHSCPFAASSVAALTLLMSHAAGALDLDIHGAMAQGLVYSEGNEVISGSEDFSTDLNEVALNARTVIGGNALLSGQLLSRRFGDAADGTLRVDFLQLDYQRPVSARTNLGGRAGRVKNPYGLYNTTRDVVFSRPGITMPSSVYFEGAGLRDLFFSSDGIQLYGTHLGPHLTHEFTIGATLYDGDSESAFGALLPPGSQGDIDIEDFIQAQWLVEASGGTGLRGGLSYLGARLDYQSDNPSSDPLVGTSLDADLYVASLQWRAQNYELTAEYRLADVATESPFGSEKIDSDGAYVQYRRFLDSGASWYLRFDASFANRNDRDGRSFAQSTGQPRFSQFAYHHVLGWRSAPAQNWGLFAEYHYVDGTEGQGASAAQVPMERYTQAIYLMLAYRF
nr:hypothetical protein [Oceanococcus sp. HetDA_MAG_MS8]